MRGIVHDSRRVFSHLRLYGCLFSVLVLICALLHHTSAHPSGVGSCGASDIKVHKPQPSGDEGYLCEALDENHQKLAEAFPGQEIYVRLSGQRGKKAFKGFQVVNHGDGTFHHLPDGSKFNKNHCALPGRVTHTDKDDKYQMELPFQISVNAAHVNFTCYIMHDILTWYKLSIEHTVIEERQSTQSRKLKEKTNISTTTADRTLPPKNCANASSLEHYDCMQQLSDYFSLHWRIGSDKSSHSDPFAVKEGDIAFALQGVTRGWVGIGFTERRGRMYPADAVVGWVMDDDAVVKAYRIHRKRIRPEDEDPSVPLSNIRATEEDGITTIKFTRSMDAGNVTIRTDEAMNVIFGIGDQDSLVRHRRSERGSADVEFYPGSPELVDQSEEGEKRAAKVEQSGEAETRTAELGNKSIPQPCANASSLERYDCMQQLSDYFSLHWRIGSDKSSHSDPFTVKEGDIAFALQGVTRGWVGIGFTERRGRMYPADAVVGWVTDDDAVVKAYRIHGDSISPDDEDATIQLMDMRAAEEDGVTTIEFIRTMDVGNVPVKADEVMSVNFAIGDEDRLIEHHHSERGSVDLNFASGVLHTDNSSPKVYYQLHGALMVIAWAGLMPLGMAAARHRWPLELLGHSGWLDVHRSVAVIVLAITVASLLIALGEFQGLRTAEGVTHRSFAIALCGLVVLQVIIPFFRPMPHHQYRWMFNMYHHWSGRLIAILAITVLHLGALALRAVLDVRIITWVVSINLAVLFHVIFGWRAEVLRWQECKRQHHQDGDIGLVGMAAMAHQGTYTAVP